MIQKKKKRKKDFQKLPPPLPLLLTKLLITVTDILPLKQDFESSNSIACHNISTVYFLSVDLFRQWLFTTF